MMRSSHACPGLLMIWPKAVEAPKLSAPAKTNRLYSLIHEDRFYSTEKEVSEENPWYIPIILLMPSDSRRSLEITYLNGKEEALTWRLITSEKHLD